MLNVKEALDAEIASLEADLAANPDPRFKRLEVLRGMLTEYTALPAFARLVTVERQGLGLKPVQPKAANDQHEHHARREREEKQRGGKASETLRAIECVREILTEKREPLTNIQLVDLLAERGITIGGKKPPNTLGAMLYNAGDEFVSGGRAGWSLKNWQQQQELAIAAE